MGGNKSVDSGGDRGFDEAVRAVIAEVFDHDVNVTVHDNRGKLDVHVEPRGVTTALEKELDDINAVQYSDLKITITDESG